MQTLYDILIQKLSEAKDSASLERAGWGFPEDRIEIKSVHFSNPTSGHVGEIIHPTDYIRRIVKLHHNTWIISPIEDAINLLHIHAETIRRTEQLVLLLKNSGLDEVISLAKVNKLP